MKHIQLKARDGTVRAHVMVDDADYDMLLRWKWCLHSKGYAERRVGPRGKCQKILLHRQLLGLGPDDSRQGEHINRDPLDCRRHNLRIARGSVDNLQNVGPYASNTSGYRGVTKRGRRWIAQCTLNYENTYIGSYDTPEQADRAVKAFRAEHMPFSDDARAAA